MVKFDLKEFRENVLKETQEQFALRLGVNEDYISRLEKIPGSIPIDLLNKLADSAGMTLDEVVTIH